MLNKKILNKGKDILYPEVEDQLVNFIEFINVLIQLVLGVYYSNYILLFLKEKN